MIFDKLYKKDTDVLNLIEKALGTQAPVSGVKNRESSINHRGSNNLLFTYLNQNCFNIYCSNKEYKNLLDYKFEVFLDGIGIYTTLKMYGYKNVQKFNATDLNEKIFTYFSEQKTSLFLIGGKFDEKFITQKTLEKRLKVVGYKNGYFAEQNIPQIAEELNHISPEVIVIAMGAPKQEIMAYKISSMIEVKLILCVGGFLEFYFNTKPRAPKVFRNAGLEWVHRMITEPSRLWKRYLIGIPVFLFNVFRLRSNMSGQHK